MPIHTHSGDRTGTGAGATVDFGGGTATFNNLSAVVTNAAPDTVCNIETSPDNTVWTNRATITGQKAASLVGLGVAFRSVRINVTALGTSPPGGKVGAVFCCS